VADAAALGGSSLVGIRDRRAVHLEDRHIVVEKVPDVEVAAIGAENRAFRQASDGHVADLRHLLSVDFEHREAAIALVTSAGHVVALRRCLQRRDWCPVALGECTNRPEGSQQEPEDLP
jgi:hypothetical protein